MNEQSLVTTKRFKIGNRAVTNVVGALLSQAREVESDDKVDLNKFVLSKSTTRRLSIGAVQKKSEKVMQKLINILETNSGTVIVGIDGKNVKQVFKNLKDAKQRLAIIAQSPDFPDKMGEQVLGVPVVQSSKGKDQLVEVIRVLNEWTIFPKLFGLRFDTTSDNTGRHIGSVTLIEKAKGHSLMWVACRHHSIEVHVKKVAKHCLGETTSPHYHLFKQLHDNWLEAVVDSDHSGIDYSSLELY